MYFSEQTLNGEKCGFFGLEYALDCFKRRDIEVMMSRWELLLNLLFVVESQASAAPLHTINLILPEERVLLETFRGSVEIYTGPATLKEVVEEQVDRTPGNVALEFEDRSLTYGELESRCNRLARFLETRWAWART